MMVKMFILLIRLYQKHISPLFPQSCRFYPTCSQYAVAAFEKYGVWRGAAKSLARIGRCHPFHPGGYDPLT